MDIQAGLGDNRAVAQDNPAAEQDNWVVAEDNRFGLVVERDNRLDRLGRGHLVVGMELLLADMAHLDKRSIKCIKLCINPI